MAIEINKLDHYTQQVDDKYNKKTSLSLLVQSSIKRLFIYKYII